MHGVFYFTTSMRKHIPNVLTCLNLACGCLALNELLFRSHDNYSERAVYFVLAAAVLDFFDGFIARLLHAQSAIGRELDSLADMVTFGLVPGAMLSMFLNSALLAGNSENISSERWIVAAGYLFTMAAALRLAKFNVDEKQRENFIGLPSPMAALFAMSLVFGMKKWYDIIPIFNLTGFIILTLFISVMMILPMPMFGMKLKSVSWNNNAHRYIFGGLAALCVLFFGIAGIAPAVLIYIFISTIQTISLKK